MKVIVCVDKGNGMMFNNRRQSRDSAVAQDIINSLSGRLFIDSYSETLFKEMHCEYTATDKPLNDASQEDSCFIENRSIAEFSDKISQMVIYCWNRKYPADFLLDFNPLACGFELVSQDEFQGTSHEKITKYVYQRLR